MARRRRASDWGSHLRNKSVGPVIYHEEGTEELKAACCRSGIVCTNLHGFAGAYVCAHRRGDGLQRVPDPAHAPDWCPLLEGQMRDVRELIENGE